MQTMVSTVWAIVLECICQKVCPLSANRFFCFAIKKKTFKSLLQEYVWQVDRLALLVAKSEKCFVSMWNNQIKKVNK